MIENYLMTVRSVLKEISNAEAVAYLTEYYSEGEPFYTGSRFETLEQENNLPDRITASDLVAVATLDTPIGKDALMGILISEEAEINGLLTQITEKPLGSLSKEEFNGQLGQGSPGERLWDALRRNRPGDIRWGVGRTRASKILARKRPHLFPISDSVVDSLVGYRYKSNRWKLWWLDFTDTETNLEQRAQNLREEAGLAELSTLRIFDVVLWMHGQKLRRARKEQAG